MLKLFQKHVYCLYKQTKIKLKQWQNLFYVIVNANSTVQKQKWNNKACQCKCKHYRKCKRDYSWNPSSCIC